MKLLFIEKVHLVRRTFFILLVLINTGNLLGQKEIYSTSTSQLIIEAHVNDISIDIKSKNLFIMLNYETGELEMKQELSSLIVNNDSLQAEFNKSNNRIIRFEGKLGLDYINTSGHEPLSFIVEGTLYPSNISIIGEGQLIHIVKGSAYACILSLSFNLNLDEVLPNFKYSDANNEVHINVIQSLLARENE